MAEFPIESIFVRNTIGVRDALHGVPIAIAGCGGLGSNCALFLARSGADRFVLVDSDVVEPSNLNRQAFFLQDIGKRKVDALATELRSINPSCSVEQHHLRLEPGDIDSLFTDVPVVVEAFDTVEGKAMLIDWASEAKNAGKWLVTVSGLAGSGKANEIRSKVVGRNIILIGDGVSKSEDGLICARVVLAAAHEALAVISILMGEPGV